VGVSGKEKLEGRSRKVEFAFALRDFGVMKLLLGGPGEEGLQWL
jgi:hypothetical protein